MCFGSLKIKGRSLTGLIPAEGIQPVCDLPNIFNLSMTVIPVLWSNRALEIGYFRLEALLGLICVI